MPVSVVWCEFVTSSYSTSSHIAEWNNSLSNVFYLLAAVYGLTRVLHTKLPIEFTYAEIVMGAVGSGSYLFHAYPSRVTQIMDELPMCVLAYCYLRCTKGRCSYTDGKCWKPLHKSYVGLLLCAFSVYLFLPVYDIFTDLFTVLLVVPGVLCGVIAKEDPRVGRNCLCLSLVALLMAKSAWNYERSLYYADSCPTSHWDPLYYLHSIWHFNSALSHLFMMIFLREASTKYARVVNGGGSYGVVAQSEV